MADNLTTQSTTPATVPSSSVIATDQVAADANAHYQKIKLVDGTADSTAVIGGSTANGLDVDVTRVQGTVTVGDGGSTLSVDDGGGSLTVDGTVGVSGSVAVTGTFYQATQPVSGTVAVTGAYQATQPVSLATAPTTPVTGTFWQATQPVSGTVTATGPLTDTQLRATAVPVSGSVTISDGSGPVTVDGTVTVTGALTDTELRAAPVPVSGTVAVTGVPAAITGFATETTLLSVDGKTPALGQASNAASVPVVLTAAQLSTLTPPGAISGFATSTKQSDGTQKSQIVDGSGNVIGSTSNALDINIKSGNASTMTVSQTTASSLKAQVELTPTTTGGLSIHRIVSAANNNAVRIKSGAGQVYGWVITNTNASPRYVKLYDSNTSPPVPGTTAVALTLMIPGNSTGTGMIAAEFTMGIAFANGIGIATLTGATDGDTTGVSANEVIINLFYK